MQQGCRPLPAGVEASRFRDGTAAAKFVEYFADVGCLLKGLAVSQQLGRLDESFEDEYRGDQVAAVQARRRRIRARLLTHLVVVCLRLEKDQN